MEDAVGRMVLVVQEFIGSGRPMGDTLTAVAALAVEHLGTDMAGLTLEAGNGKPRTVVSTHPAVPAIDQPQYDVGRGPCLDAWREGELKFIGDTLDEPRWPEFARAAAEAGMRSTMSVPVRVGEGSIGALNFYDGRPGRFGTHVHAEAEAFAGQLAVVAAYYEKADTADQLAEAIRSRAVIEQAKGVLMATVGCSAEEAFDLLRQQSQVENVKLRAIAAEIVARATRRP